jgi:hypothetical protein
MLAIFTGTLFSYMFIFGEKAQYAVLWHTVRKISPSYMFMAMCMNIKHVFYCITVRCLTDLEILSPEKLHIFHIHHCVKLRYCIKIVLVLVFPHMLLMV